LGDDGDVSSFLLAVCKCSLGFHYTVTGVIGTDVETRDVAAVGVVSVSLRLPLLSTVTPLTADPLAVAVLLKSSLYSISDLMAWLNLVGSKSLR
jgi:hypothetical protein